MIVLAALALAQAAAAAEAPRLSLSLAEAEAAALAHSPRLKAAAQQLSASRASADSQWALLIPRFTLDGSYRYYTAAPQIPTTPGSPPLPFSFGSHRATSIGPSLSWTLWDQGGLYNGWRAALESVRSSADAEKLARRQSVLGVRLAYFQVQLALEEARLLADSMALAESQYEDIGKRLKLGSVSRVDALSAHREALERRRDFRSAQAELATALRELFALAGRTGTFDLSRPIDSRSADTLPADAGAPTLLLSLDPLSARPPKLAAAASRPFDEAHPEAALHAHQAEADRWSARSVSAGLWPKIQLSGRASYDYPNTPLLEYVQQNTVALTASFPLFEAGKTRRQAEGRRKLAAAAEESRRQAFDDLKRDWLKARDQLEALRDQEILDRDSVSESDEIARLKYVSYQEGSLTFLEVQSANLSALQAKASAARTEAQILIRLATLDSLSTPEANP